MIKTGSLELNSQEEAFDQKELNTLSLISALRSGTVTLLSSQLSGRSKKAASKPKLKYSGHSLGLNTTNKLKMIKRSQNYWTTFEYGLKVSDSLSKVGINPLITSSQKKQNPAMMKYLFMREIFRRVEGSICRNCSLLILSYSILRVYLVSIVFLITTTNKARYSMFKMNYKS